jgi:hypothetical protein
MLVPEVVAMASKPDYTHLPEPIRLEDTRAVSEPDPAPDPDGGRDPETEFMLRYGQ